MKKIYKILCLFVFLNLASIIIADNLWASEPEVDVYLSADRLTFFEGNPVLLKISVKNTNDYDIKLPVYNADYTTFQPVVFDLKGREAQTRVKYRLMNRSLSSVVKNIKPRSVILGPGETLTHELDLRKFYDLKKGGKYKVRGFFISNMKSRTITGSDNMLYLSISSRKEDVSNKRESAYGRKITPSEVLRLFLVAEKEEKWDNYLKYINLEKYINAFSDYSLAFNSGSPAVKKSVLSDFIHFLSSSRQDYILDFKILKESVVEDRDVAYVDVKVKRYGGAYPFTYMYKYTLERFKDFWIITGVEATVTREFSND